MAPAPSDVGLVGPTGAPIRVVHLGKYYPPAAGGIETHVRTLATEQSALGCSVDVVAINHESPLRGEVTFDHFARTRSRNDQDGEVNVHRIGRQFTVARFDGAARLVPRLRALGRTKPDLWHLHAPNITMSLAALAMPSIRPLVVTHHSDIVRQKMLGRLVTPLLRSLYSRAAAILVTSPNYAAGSDLLDRFADKVHCIPLGIDLAPFETPSDAALRFAASLRDRYPGPLWLMIGRLVYYKGHDIAIRALPKVPGTLVCIGSGPEQAGLLKQAEAQGVADRIAWLGRAGDDELVGAYRAATALWLASPHRAEAYGLVQIEAMASGCPVINCDIPDSGVPWVCRHEHAGLTVPIRDPDALANASRRLLDEPGLRARLIENGRRDATERFAASIMAKQSLALYRSILAQRAPRPR